MLKSVVLAGMLLNVGMVSVCAKTTVGTLVAKRAELKAVKSKISVVDHHIDDLLIKQQEAEQQLIALDKKIAGHATALRELQHQIDQKNTVVNKTETSIRRQIAQVEQQKQALKKQILAAYHVNQQGRIKLMLNNQDPALVGRLLKYYECLNKGRMAKIAQLEVEENKLVFLQRQQKQVVAMIERDLQGKQSEQVLITEAKQARAKMLQQVRQQVVHGKKLLVQLKENERSLKALLASLQQPTAGTVSSAVDEAVSVSAAPVAVEGDQGSPAREHEEAVAEGEAEAAHIEPVLMDSNNRFSQLKGQLGWPVVGTVHSKKDADTLEAGRGGVLIEADEGSSVHAVASGKVVYAGWLKGYGLLTIVNHGEGYMTIYAFNQSVFKKVGHQVQGGEAIASVGQSGGRSMSGLYFEIRKNGIPLNPMLWCKK